jgi:ATP-binding cassette, subfamily B, bacterial
MPDITDRPRAKSLRPLQALLPFLTPHRTILLGALAALLAAAAAMLVVPASLRGLIDHGLATADSAVLNHYLIGFLAASVAFGVFAALRFYLVTWMGERVIADLRRAVYRNVVRLDPTFFETTRTGEVLSRLTADTTLVQTVIGSSASVALRNLVTLSGGLVLMFFTSLKLTLLILGAVLAIMVPLILFGRWVRALSRTSQDRIADSSARASETLNAVQTVQAFTHESEEKRVFGGTVEQSFAAAIIRTRARAVMTAVVIFSFFTALASVLYVGAQDVMAQRMTGGLLLQFILLGGLVAGGVGSLSEVWGDLQRAAGASERLMELLHQKPAIAPPALPLQLVSPARGAIAFEHVTFHYPSRPDSAALQDFSLAVAPGEAVALVGPSGAGKSTVFQLLLRFFAAGQGRILFDGVDIAQVDPLLLRRHIAVVSQEPVIFSGSIASNIGYGRLGAGREAVRRAADAAAATEFIEKLPDGFDTLVGERGVTLSGGQRQRLAIARAILRDAPLLLLDEATSALDAENELLVQQGLANLMVGRTTLVIAHRLATIQKLARIVVMDQGRVVGQGSHGELVGQGGLYARLAQLQFTTGSLQQGPLEKTPA